MKRGVKLASLAFALMFIMASAANAQCVGDCDDGGDVVVSELITGINIALGSAAVSVCPSFDDNNDSGVTVNELILAINNALQGCPPPTAECGNGQKEGDEFCDDGNTEGGDGCAANCTEETRLQCVLDESAQARLQTSNFPISLPLSGELFLTAGGANGDNGEVPVVMRADDLQAAPVPVVGVVCACVMGGELEQFGPGNAGKGRIGCGPEGLAEVDYLASADHNTNDIDPNCDDGVLEDGSAAHPHAGVCNGKTVVTYTGGGPRGSAVMDAAVTLSLIADGGACTENCDIPDNGPDCLPCTADDLGATDGKSLPLTTGIADGELLDADNSPGKKISADSMCGGDTCVTSAQASPLNCDLLVSEPANALSGAGLVGALASIDTAQLGDAIVNVVFGCE